MRIKYFPFIILPLLFLNCQTSSTSWPEVSQQTKPWSRWWWHGSAVNKQDISQVMELYRDAGLGGLELTPIFGVKGEENQFIDYLSEEWMNMFLHSLKEAERLDLGMDMATGTGWPFGGPWINDDHASKYLAWQKWTLESGETLTKPVQYIQEPIVRLVNGSKDIEEIKYPLSENSNLQALAADQIRYPVSLPLITLMAYSDEGTVFDITYKVDDKGKLDWIAPEGNWTLYGLFQGYHGKMVERSAPGGEGPVLDHFSQDAINNYLNKFDSAISGHRTHSLRAYFNDSYEVDDARGEADYTPDFFQEFKNRKGYDIRYHLPVLFSEEITENKKRLLCDYREVISDLLLEKFTLPWKAWANSQSKIIRNQAHGSPANILDLYAASDIPETEGHDILRFKFASSAANLTGKQLISAEAATWLKDHFLSSLADVKACLDQFFLGGVNHVVYHGTPYSPKNADWPGWMFYASVHFAPTNTFWDDFSALNNYVTRCQSFLQSGKSDNDILLYFPFHDRISEPGRSMLQHFRGEGPRGYESEFRKLAQLLLEEGYTLDYISDKQIQTLAVKNGIIKAQGADYQTIVLPNCEYIPLETIESLMECVEKGATIIFDKQLPQNISGYSDWEYKTSHYKKLINELIWTKDSNGIQTASVGKGVFLLSYNLAHTLNKQGIYSEMLTGYNLDFIRRKHNHGHHYFILNNGKKIVDGWISANKLGQSAILFNPMSGDKGLAKLKRDSVYLQLHPGESCILKTFRQDVKDTPYAYLQLDDHSIELNKGWKVDFIKGGPILPESIQLKNLDSWTAWDHTGCQSFSGTAKYKTTFSKPDIASDYWILDLGTVHESARIFLNGEYLGTRFTTPWQIRISDRLLNNENTLEIEVANLMANRIIDMDKKEIEYKKFYNINFPSRRGENQGDDGLFSSARLKPFPSGLLGPVKIFPVEIMD